MIGQKEKACPFAWDLLALFSLYRTLYRSKDTKIHLDAALTI